MSALNNVFIGQSFPAILSEGVTFMDMALKQSSRFHTLLVLKESLLLEIESTGAPGHQRKWEVAGRMDQTDVFTTRATIA